MSSQDHRRSTASRTSRVVEPWDTPEREGQARAHEVALRKRRHRHSLVFLGAVLVILLVFVAALVIFKGWLGGPLATATPTPCPAQTVAKPAETSVRVLNSTSRPGLASSVAKTLKGRGYVINAVGNAQSGTAGASSALIVYGAGGVERARAVAAQVAGAKLRGDARTSTTVDIIIGDKFKAVRPAKDAAPLLKQVTMPEGCVPAT